MQFANKKKKNQAKFIEMFATEYPINTVVYLFELNESLLRELWLNIMTVTLDIEDKYIHAILALLDS